MFSFYKSPKKQHIAVILFTVFASFVFHAYSSGITGVTLKNGQGCTCHGGMASGVTVTINGPASLQVGETGNYTVTVTGGPLVKAGTNIAASSGTLTAGTGLQLMSGELTHTAPKSPDNNTVTFSFQYTAPATTGNVTLYANGNSVNDNGGSDGDSWNFASNKVISVTNIIPVELSSFSSSVTGSDVTLTWSTATETNNKGFIIEKLRVNPLGDEELKEGEWENIGFAAGSGTSTEKRSYTFTDKNVLAGVYKYRLVQTDFDGSSKIYVLAGEVDITTVSGFELAQNYPNPFNPETKISFSLPSQENVVIKLYNMAGQEISTLVNSRMDAGNHSLTLCADGLSSGVYLYKMTAGGFTSTKKLSILK
ncbi:MAG: T9SS type A sorting domain-containing protein [Ignavibacteriaceae bacterium]|nr:T9SS type A sorting domain-containing protein [Ignavibacteriaceae bacterium]